MENLIYFAIALVAWWMVELSWGVWFMKTTVGQVVWSRSRRIMIISASIAGIVEMVLYWLSWTGSISPWIGIGLWFYNLTSMVISTLCSGYFKKRYGNAVKLNQLNWGD